MIKKFKMFNESDNFELGSSEDILSDLVVDLEDQGLFVNFKNDNKFSGKFYVEILDKEAIFCNYPANEMDWLYNKTIIKDFLNRLDIFGLKRDVDFKVYGGGLGVNLVFKDIDVIKRRYNEN